MYITGANTWVLQGTVDVYGFHTYCPINWILKVNIWKVDLNTINKPQVYRMTIEVKWLLRKSFLFIHIIQNIHVAKQLDYFIAWK